MCPARLARRVAFHYKEPVALTRFARLAWGTLGFNVLVMAWGAYVRATFSGDGCGSHWPLCNGEVVPHPHQVKTVIELSHRVSAGVGMALVYALTVWAFRTRPTGAVRRTAAWASVFVSMEAVIGAVIVLFKLVSHDESKARALSMCLHLSNTFVLLTWLTLTAHYASGGAPMRLEKQGVLAHVARACFAGVMLLGVTGAIAALGDTLFPPHSLAEGLAQDLSVSSHILLRLRALHPFGAVVVAVLLLSFAAYVPPRGPASRRFARALSALVLTQLSLGVLNLVLHAPVWMQLLHLVTADAVWVCLVMLSATSFATAGAGADAAPAREGVPSTST